MIETFQSGLVENPRSTGGTAQESCSERQQPPPAANSAAGAAGRAPRAEGGAPAERGSGGQAEARAGAWPAAFLHRSRVPLSRAPIDHVTAAERSALRISADEGAGRWRLDYVSTSREGSVHSLAAAVPRGGLGGGLAGGRGRRQPRLPAAVAAEQAVYLSGSALAGIGRFAILRAAVFTDARRTRTPALTKATVAITA